MSNLKWYWYNIMHYNITGQKVKTIKLIILGNATYFWQTSFHLES